MQHVMVQVGVRVGGISGNNTNGKIFNCYNVGKIECNSSTNGMIGGIIGLNADGEALVKNCYNLGGIYSKSNSYTGGIIGNIYRGSKCENCYTTGKIFILESVVKGKVIGSQGESGNEIVKKCYGLDEAYNSISNMDNTEYVVDCALKPSSEMKTQEFVDLLNTNNDDSPWEVDTTNINKGYPILKWQLNNNN